MVQLKLPEDLGYIVRTWLRAEQTELSKDVTRLVRMWKTMRERVPEAPALSLIHKEQDLCFRTIRDSYNSDTMRSWWMTGRSTRRSRST